MYTFGLFLISFFYAPYFFYQMAFKGKYRKSFLNRWGKGFPEAPENKRVIWIHAVSFGEARAVEPLIKKIKASHPDSWVLLTVVTETGFAEGKKGSADSVYYLPFDFVIRPIVRRLKPSLVILCETDYWYNFLDEAKKNGAEIVVVNGKISEASQKRFQLVPGFCRNIFSLVDLLIVQNSLYKNRFLELGIPEEKLKVGGNIKLDSDPEALSPEALSAFKDTLGIKDEPVLVVGSTHDPEEKLFLDAFQKANIPNLKMILVPRHPERFDAVAKLIEERHIPYSRFSKSISPDSKIILIDAMGQLKKCYQIATVAAVCGSWTPKVGGHNILEPSFYGKPVLFGPHMFTQPDFLVLMKDYGAGFQISNAELLPTLVELFENSTKREATGKQGKKLVEESRGALERTYSLIFNNDALFVDIHVGPLLTVD